MITVRKSEDRFLSRHGWLTSHHTFSFAHHYDPRFVGFRDLLVINEDTVVPGRGFGAHRHDNMEIISIVMEGSIAHRDSTGGEGVLRRGEVQRMSAGTGVVHSEFNASESEPVHFFQIWIEPERRGIEPSYEQKLIPYEERLGKLRLLVAPGGRDGALHIHQDALLYSAVLESGQTVDYRLSPGRAGWIQVATGSIDVNGTMLKTGDGAAIEGVESLSITASEEAEILLFDLH